MSNKATKINKSDLQFYPSERLSDYDDGGGMPTGKPIKGIANEIFNPISSLARVAGFFGARLIYAGVRRADAEKLIGANVAITKPPADTSVSYLLFKASKFGELRAEGIKRIEAHSVATIESRMTLFSTQTKNSKIVQAYQRQGEPLPLVGNRYCLRQDKKGYENVEQYIQVTAVQAEDRTFTNPQTNKDFVRTVIQLEISQKLEHDFIGAEYPSEYYIDNPCKIRETHVADAGEYFGVKPIVKAIQQSDMQIHINGLMEKLVPTNQIETALTDLSASGQRQMLFDASKQGDTGLVNYSVQAWKNTNETQSVYTGNAILPKSINLQTSAGIINDVGGTLKLGEQSVGSVDYASGVLLINEPSFSAYLQVLSFRPSINDIAIADTASIDISINNRGYTYVRTIEPSPAVGTLQVSYRSQGQWYNLYDNGNGVLVGASQAHGSGSINYNTGTINISCGELPDVGSAILMSWGTRAKYFNRSDSTAKAQLMFNLQQQADPSTIRLTWQDNGEKSATCSANGKITGDWTGRYDATQQQILIDTDNNFAHPKGALQVKVDYSYGEKTHQQHKAPLRDEQGRITLDLGDTPIQPNSVRLRWNLLIENYESPIFTEITPNLSISFIDPYKTVRDDGKGNLVDENNEPVGTIDYAQRRLTFNPDTTVSIPKAKYKTITVGESQQVIAGIPHTVTEKRQLFAGYEYIPAGASMPIDESGLAEVWFFDTSSKNSHTETLASDTLQLQLLPNFAETIAPSSVNFSLNGSTHLHYFDKNGIIYCNLDSKTGDAVKAGTINYQTGVVILKHWQWLQETQLNINALATSITGNPVDRLSFRTPSSPIRPASLHIRATALDGSKINAIADLKGEIKGKNISGTVDVEMGIVQIKFGEQVGDEWQSRPVFAESLMFNAVAYSYLPVDSSIVKIDTVRLPQDGRVPIFRRGDMILIGNRQHQNIGSAFTAGQTIQLDRQNLDRICITDADDNPVNAELWDYDLDAGTITWKTPLDLSSYKMPLKVMHAQEEQNRILKADIDGTLSLIFPLKHSYPVENTYVSSVLVSNTPSSNLEVHHSIPFTQRNWSNKWQNEPEGEQLLNRLNLLDYPMVLTDDGAITERWLIKWVSSSQFELYGETLGFVMKTDTLQDLAPINPHTQKPYFTIPRQAFGNDAPWATQDIIRFNTWGTLLPVWVLCAVQPSTNKQDGEDGFTMCIFGDTTEVIYDSRN